MIDSAPIPFDAKSEIENINSRLDQHAKALKENTDATNRIEANTNELVELLNAVRGAFKVLNVIGTFAKPIAYIVTAVTAFLGFVAAIKAGHKP